jgi:hypothetical protein
LLESCVRFWLKITIQTIEKIMCIVRCRGNPAMNLHEMQQCLSTLLRHIAVSVGTSLVYRRLTTEAGLRLEAMRGATLPFGDHQGRQGITEYVQRGGWHFHQSVHASDKGNALQRQAGAGQRG